MLLLRVRTRSNAFVRSFSLSGSFAGNCYCLLLLLLLLQLLLNFPLFLLFLPICGRWGNAAYFLFALCLWLGETTTTIKAFRVDRMRNYCAGQGQQNHLPTHTIFNLTY